MLLIIPLLIVIAAYGFFAVSGSMYEFSYACSDSALCASYGGSKKISTFSTSFATSSEGRAHNVMLAASNYTWFEVGPGEEMSFNSVVGARTADRGYKNARVINNGVYVDGIGGGVCQVSSTLYCAWVRAGLGVKYVQGHSLPSSYCDMSQDATVSEAIDLVLINDSDNSVFINGYTVDRKLIFDIFGATPEYSVKLRTQILGVIPAGEDVEYVDSLPGGELSKVVTQPKDGYRTCLIAEYYKDGNLCLSKVLRNDSYRPTDKKILMVAD
ncbi:MAG: VanW family protein [Clostridia bacterium]|nr:VanW family protein [Clostridia bacterium]